MKKIFTKICIIVGIILRAICGVLARPYAYQHDVMMDGGHYHYAAHIFSTLSLPFTRYGEFYQPPLNAFFSAMWMKLMSIFIRPKKSIIDLYDVYISGKYDLLFTNKSLNDYILKLYETTKYLQIIYSIITFIIICMIIKKIKKVFDGKLSIIFENFAVIVMAIYPGMVLMSSQYSNDNLSYMFFFLSIYIFILWLEKNLSILSGHILDNEVDKKNDIRIILLLNVILALSIGLAMMTKMGTAVISIILAPMMVFIFCKFICKSSEYKKIILLELFLFFIIVIPISLWYPIRNSIIYNQPLFYVRKLTDANSLYTGGMNIIDRIFSFPIARLFDKNSFIYHDTYEYNIWIDLIKTSTFDERVYSSDNIFCIIIYAINIIFHLFAFTCLILNIIMTILFFIKKLTHTQLTANSYKLKANQPLPPTPYLLPPNPPLTANPYMLTAIFSYIYLVALISYTTFNISYPASCSSNYRYILYITFAETLNIFIVIYNIRYLKRIN